MKRIIAKPLIRSKQKLYTKILWINVDKYENTIDNINIPMLIDELFETYSDNLSYLKKYLRDRDFDPYHYWWAICQWAETDDMLGEFSEIAGREIESGDDLNEEEPDIFYKLPKHAQEEAAEWVINYMARHDPADLDSRQFLSLRNNQLLKRDTWLIHFTDDPDSISENGFKYGTYDMSRLGLTTYFKNSSKASGGYNFAFIADSRYARWAASEGKYGKHAVMFQSSGVHAWHNSDEEDQIIFWGPDVKPREIIVLMNGYDDWEVQSKDDRTIYKGGKNGGEFEKCVDWVINNYQQYRKVLTGF